MKIVFISNYMTHHQYYLCDQIRKNCDSFTFVQTEKMSSERINLGWQQFSDDMITEDVDALPEILSGCDAVICGGVSNQLMSKVRGSLGDDALIFVYSESLFKKSRAQQLNLASRYKVHKKYADIKNCYLLAAGAYVAYDYSLCGLFKGRAYKWGYFPELENVPERKIFCEDELRLWGVGRFLDWKHPEDALHIVKRLCAFGTACRLTMIGTGVEEDNIKRMISSLGIEDRVSLLGAKKSQEVREYMRSADALLFTSDRGEGWGVVANEAINSRCLVIGCEEAGSVPFLLSSSTGIVYKRNDLCAAAESIKRLCESPEKANEMASDAYRELEANWTPAVAAKRFCELVDCLKNKKEFDVSCGACSKADIIKH